MTPLAAALLAAALPAGAADLLASWDLSADDAGMVPGDGLQWEWGAVGSGPGSGYAGGSAWATRLDGPYLNDASDTLSLPAWDLSSATRPVLALVHWYAIEPDGDQGVLEVPDGADRAALEPVYGYPDGCGFSGGSGGWTVDWFDLTGLSDLADARLAFSSTAAASADGWYVGALALWDGDPVPPRVEVLEAPADTQDLVGPYTVRVAAEDDAGAVVSATLHWDDGGGERSVAMEDGGDGTWSAGIEAAEPGAEPCWRVEVEDEAGNTGATEEACFSVYLAAPTDLVAGSDRVVGETVELDWSPPDAPYPVVGYRVWRNGALVAEPDAPPVDAPLEGPVDTFEVSAVFDTPIGEREGDRSESVEVEAAVPAIASVEPAEGWQGDDLRVDVVARNLFMVDGEVEAELGDGVEVVDVDVRDVDLVVLRVRIAADADPGPRDLALASGVAEARAEGGFTVRDGADRPRLLSVEPDRAAQGEEAEVVLVASAELEGEPAIDLGDGVIVQSVEWSGAEVRALVAVERDAPLGERDVTVDDGRRVLEGVRFTVEDDTPPPRSACGCAAAPRRGFSLPVIAAVLAAALGRRGGRRGTA